jgi:hypothetical protein
MTVEVRSPLCSPQMVRRTGRSDVLCMTDALTVQNRPLPDTFARRHRPKSLSTLYLQATEPPSPTIRTCEFSADVAGQSPDRRGGEVAAVTFP